MEKENGFIETIELKSMFEKAKELKKGRDYHSLQDAFLISAHSFVGGARSKAVGAINLHTKEVFLGDRTKPLKDGFIHAIIKYDDTTNSDENKSTYSKVEYIYYILAKKCGIDMSDCYLVQTDDKQHFVTKRFDIEFVVASLEKMKNLRDKNLPQLLKKYEVKLSKQKQIIEHVNKRTLQGVL